MGLRRRPATGCNRTACPASPFKTGKVNRTRRWSGLRGASRLSPLLGAVTLVGHGAIDVCRGLEVLAAPLATVAFVAGVLADLVRIDVACLKVRASRQRDGKTGDR